MRKICVVITARASYSRCRSVLRAIQAHPDLELQLVITASAMVARYAGIVETVEEDGFPIAAKLFTLIEGDTLVTAAKSTAMALLELAPVLDQLRPDAVVTIADRAETTATALAAAHLNIPLVHIQGGELTGSIDEKIRHAVTKLATVHCVATQLAYNRVRQMGERAIYWTGCPSIDIAATVAREPAGLAFDPYARYGGVGACPDLAVPFLVVLQHAVPTEYAAARDQIDATITAVAQSGLPALWFWPNADAGTETMAKALRESRESASATNWHVFRGMRPEDFLRLLRASAALVGNSSVGIRECAYLGVPVVNIGTRQQRRERGRNVVTVPPDRAAILSAIHAQAGRARDEMVDPLYGDGCAGVKIAGILAQATLPVEKQWMQLF